MLHLAGRCLARSKREHGTSLPGRPFLYRPAQIMHTDMLHGCVQELECGADCEDKQMYLSVKTELDLGRTMGKKQRE